MATYESQGEADLRLKNCVVVYDKSPLLVQAIDEELNVMGVLWPSGRQKVICKLDDQKLQIKEIPLGYVNLSTCCSYVQRVPIRKYRQGLFADNVYISHVNPPRNGHLGWREIYQSTGFKDTINNVYPNVEEAMSRLTDTGPTSVAFSRTLAISRNPFRGDFELYYKGDPIAFGEAKGFMLSAESSFLREVLLNQPGLRLV